MARQIDQREDIIDPMALSQEEQSTVLSPKEVAPVRVRLNEPFTINPPKDLAEQIGSNIHLGYLWGVKLHVEAPLVGDDGQKGTITIRESFRGVDLKGDETLHTPVGDPRYAFRLDKSTGMMIPEALPIQVNFQFGPFTHESTSGNEFGFSVIPYGREYRAADPRFSSQGNGQNAVFISGIKYTDVSTGKTGPMILPSGADFRKIQFVFRKTPVKP